MTSCEDLTPSEHEALLALQSTVTGRAKVIGYTRLPVPQVHIDALIETGHVGWDEVGTKRQKVLLQPCTCSKISGAVTRGNEKILVEGLRSEARSEYTGAAGYGGATPADGSTSSLATKPRGRRFSSYRLATLFDNESRKYSWECGMSVTDKKSLARQMKLWHESGASEDDIREVMGVFFRDLSTGDKLKGPLWKLFVSKRKRSVEIATRKRKVGSGERSADSARAFQASERALLGLAGERSRDER